MKRASFATDPLRNGSGSANRCTVAPGPRPEETAHHRVPWPGAPAAVELLFDRYHGKIYGLAMSILRNKRDAEEATRDVFLTVMGKTDPFQWNSSFQLRIYRICVDACLTRLRKDRRTEPVPIEDFLPVFTREGSHAGPVEDWNREVERRIPEKELRQVIGRFTEVLPEKYLVVFALRDIQGFSHEETAQILSLTTSEVASRLYRARLYLRERLGRYLRDGRMA